MALWHGHITNNTINGQRGRNVHICTFSDPNLVTSFFNLDKIQIPHVIHGKSEYS
jgi:hypothetical protein